jgi:hypothetical protein
VNEHQAEMEPTVEEERDYWQRMANQHSVKIMSLSNEYNRLLKELTSLRSQVVPWRDGGARGGDTSRLEHGGWYLIHSGGAIVVVWWDINALVPGFREERDGSALWLFAAVENWCPLSEIPTPRN